MEDEDFEALLDRHLDPPGDPNPEMAGVQLVLVRDDERCGTLHMEAHGVTEEEVEQVLLEIPPFVEARTHRDFPDRTVFWGVTRRDRWLVIPCVDWEENGVRYLKPITAFEPEDGEEYGVRP